MIGRVPLSLQSVVMAVVSVAHTGKEGTSIDSTDSSSISVGADEKCHHTAMTTWVKQKVDSVLCLQTATTATSLFAGRVSGDGGDILDPANADVVPGKSADGRLGTRARGLGLGSTPSTELNVHGGDATELAVDRSKAMPQSVTTPWGRERERWEGMGMDEAQQNKN